VDECMDLFIDSKTSANLLRKDGKPEDVEMNG